MSFTRANVAGWAPLEEFTAAQANTIDINQSRAIDGTGGGTYTPGAVILIAGTFGLELDAPFRADGTFTVNSATALFTENVQISEILQVNSAIDLNGTLDCSGNASFHGDMALGDTGGDTVTVNAQFVAVASATFLGATGFSAAVTLGDAAADNIIVSGTLFANAPAFFADDTRFDDPVFFAGDGRIQWRIVTFTTDANQTIAPVNGSIFVIGDGIQTGSRNWTIDDTGMVNGDWFIASTTDLSFTSVIKDPATNTIGTIKLNTGFPSAQLFMKIGGAWRGLLVGNIL